jgi:hypothetical protein
MMRLLLGLPLPMRIPISGDLGQGHDLVHSCEICDVSERSLSPVLEGILFSGMKRYVLR